MSLTTRAGLLAGATALTLSGVAAAATTDANNDELKAQVQKLSARVAELEGAQGGNWLTEQRAAEIRSVVQDVLADADTRASLLGSGMSAGYDNGFTVGSADGNFLLRTNGLLQARWIYNHRKNPSALPPAFGVDRHRSGFEANRVQLWFSGHVVNPNWRYMIEMDLDRFGGGGFELLDAYIQHVCDNGLIVTVGQFQLPFLREQAIHPMHQLAVERSLLHTYWGVGRSQGIQVQWNPNDFLRFYGAYSNGMAALGNLASTNNWSAYDTEYAFTARGEWLVSGNWSDFNDYRSENTANSSILLGGAIHYERAEFGVFGITKPEIFRATVDAMIKFGQVSIFGAYIFNHFDPNVVGGGNIDDHSFLVQLGLTLNTNWDVFLRYEHTLYDNARMADDLSILTGGVNYYFAGHQAKMTADIGYGFNDVFYGTGSSQTGWRADNGRKGQWVIRTQLQLGF